MEIIEETVMNDNNEEIILYRVNDIIFSTLDDARNYVDTYSSMDL